MTEHELFSKALAYASAKHAGQTRRDGSPYIYHPIAVAILLKDAGYGMKYQITALLHDVLEDTDATIEEVSFFGPDILYAVQLLTREKGADETEYVSQILTNPIATAVKNADKIHNLWDMPFIDPVGEKRSPKSISFGNRYIEKANLYYRGKFSSALDESILQVEELLKSGIVSKRIHPCYDKESMKLYTF